MAEFNEVYRRARYYDIAFGRDISAEVAFILELAEAQLGRPLRSLVEIACGPGYHVRAFARHGVAATGLDLRPEMIDFARGEARADGVEAEWLVGDMRRFALERPVDAIITMYDSLDCLLTNDELIAHFRAVAANLVPGGLYLFELTHPRDCSIATYGGFRYAGERDGVRVVIDWAINRPQPDPLTAVAEVETVMRVYKDGKVEAFFDRARERLLTPLELDALVRLSGALEPPRFYGDFRFDQPLDNSPGARRMIGALRRPA